MDADPSTRQPIKFSISRNRDAAQLCKRASVENHKPVIENNTLAGTLSVQANRAKRKADEIELSTLPNEVRKALAVNVQRKFTPGLHAMPKGKSIQLNLYSSGFSVGTGPVHPYNVDARSLLRGIDLGITNLDLFDLGDVIDSAMIDGCAVVNIVDRRLSEQPTYAQVLLRSDTANMAIELDQTDLTCEQRMDAEQKLLV